MASEVGVSNWLVRFLDPAPLTTATLALSLYWAGLTVGRLISSAIADRFDHLRFTLASALLMAALLAVAILAPTLPLSIAAFALGGRRVRTGVPDDRRHRRRALPGSLGVGRWLAHRHGDHRVDRLPAAMGVLSVTVGLTVAMLGTVVLALCSAAALVAFGRATARTASEA